MSSTVTSDFRHEFDQRMGQWLRKRFLWYTGIVAAITVLSMPLGILGLWRIKTVPIETFARQLRVSDLLAASNARDSFALSTSIALVAGILGGGLYAFAYVRTRRSRTAEQATVLRWASQLIIINGFLSLLSSLITFFVMRDISQGNVTMNSGINTVSSVFIGHFIACAFIPWNWKQSLQPMLPVGALLLVVTLITQWGEWTGIIFSLLALPVVLIPGILICLFRTSRFRKRFQFDMLRGSYGEMKRELTEAQRIHEALFPAPIEQGPIRFAYAYEAMKQLGGDFVYTHTSNNNQTLTLVLIDVTGHGLTAALTVNRLHGELAREFGASPNASPGDILTGLNDYLHYTLATHSVYATALCIQIDTTNDTLTWASAGHPPAFVMAVNGKLDRLDSTTIVLGACRGTDFVADPQTITFRPGDAVFAYTDGIIETRGHDDKMLRIEGLQALLTTQPPDQSGGWCTAIMRSLEQLRAGPSQDDTLLVELYRPLNTTTPAKR